MKLILAGVFLCVVFISPALAQGQADERLQAAPPADARGLVGKPGETSTQAAASQLDEQVNYTLGPDDVIDVSVARHSEFSGVFPVNQEGKIQYKFIGDIDVNGYTKKELEARIKNIISGYVVDPQVDVTIVDYRSKVIYVIGEVSMPGKYYMRSETIPVREAVVQAGLPTVGAAMRKCRLITPGPAGKVKTRYVDVYSVLYGGNLKFNVDMKPGEVLYVPSTIMSKLMRVIAPIAAPIVTAGDAQTGLDTLNTRNTNTNQRVRY
ncbi:MAG: polysaccharide biosynthesis/export family protein [Deltaproteobacteria bacterium]